MDKLTKVIDFLKETPVQYLATVGRAVFQDSMAAKELCFQDPIVKSQYGEPTNPIFQVFYLEDPHGRIADFSGEPPYLF